MKIKPVQYYLKKQEKGTLTLTDKLALSYISMQSFDRMTVEEMGNHSNQERYQNAYQSFYSTFYRTLQSLSKTANASSPLKTILGAEEFDNLDYDHSIKDIKEKYPVEKVFQIFDRLENHKSEFSISTNLISFINEETKKDIINQFPFILPKESLLEYEKEEENMLFNDNEENSLDEIDDPYRELNKSFDQLLDEEEEEDLEDDEPEKEVEGKNKFLPERTVKGYKSLIEEKVNSKSIGPEYDAKQSLNDLRSYRQHYAKYSLFSRITATIFGAPKVVADDRKWINMIKKSCEASNIPDILIEATAADVSKEDFDNIINNAKGLQGKTISSYSMGLFHELAEAVRDIEDANNNPPQKGETELSDAELYNLVKGYDFNKDLETNKEVAKQKAQEQLKNLNNDTNMSGPKNENNQRIQNKNQSLEKGLDNDM